MKKSLFKSVTNAEQDPTEKPKMKFNTRHNLRRKAAHLSINTEKEEGVHAKFKSSEREGGDNRINTELANSQTFHDNTVTDEQFRQPLQAMVDELMR